MTEKELVAELIQQFKDKRNFWTPISADRAWGIQECINHLYAYQQLIKGEQDD
jgi:hypothetical protein